MFIVSAAHTRGCTFLLDDAGICRWVLPRSEDALAILEADAMQRCVGAQFLASLDPPTRAQPAPALGAPMLFAYLGEGGRIAVIRTMALEEFESVDESGVHDRATLESIAPTTQDAPSNLEAALEAAAERGPETWPQPPLASFDEPEAARTPALVPPPPDATLDSATSPETLRERAPESGVTSTNLYEIYPVPTPRAQRSG